MKKVLAVSLVVVAMLSGTVAAYDDEVVGEVVSSRQAPLQCKERSRGVSNNSVVTALIGGAIGNQFGDGNGRAAMTALGAVVGAGVGSSNRQANEGRMDCRSDGYISVIQFVDQYGNVLQTSRKTVHQLRVGTEVLITPYY